VAYRALVDSGADCCLFPLSLSRALGLDPHVAVQVEGITSYGVNPGEGHNAFFWPITLQTTADLSVSASIGFSEELEDSEFGILGQNGFFTEFSWICFNLKDRVFTVKTKGPSPTA
jgi:hypothetical protein